jgi:MFS family permease
MAVGKGIVFIYLGSLLMQIVQIAGYPVLLALILARADYPSWAIGIILSGQWVVVLVLAPLVPGLIKRLGIRSTGQAGAVVSIVAVTLLLLSQSTAVTVASSLLMGAGLALRWVVCDTWIVETVPEKLRGRAIGTHETLLGLSATIGPLLIILSDGNYTAALIGYIILLALALVSFAFGPQVSAAETGEERSDTERYIFMVFRILLLALLAALAAGYIEPAMVALLPLYLMNFHYPEAQALVLLSVFGLGGAVLQMPLGWIADRWSFRVGQVLCLSLVIIGGILLMTAIGLPSVVAVSLFIFGGGAAGLNTLAVIEAGSTLRAGMKGMGMALIASSYTLGGVVGPAVSGSTLNLAHGHGAILVILGLMMAYAATLAFAGRHRFSP